jgi:hypothetical protein
LSVSLAQFWSPLAWRWIEVSFLASLLVSMASVGLDALATFHGQTGTAASVFNYAVAIVVYACVGLVTGVLTGSVLQRILPMLAARTWVALYVALGAFQGAWFETMRTPGSADTGSAWPSFAAIFLFYGIYGASWGVLVGGFEALVLRSAARSVGGWIQWSAIAGAVGAIAFVFVWMALSLMAGRNEPVVREISYVIGSVATAITMLPALVALKSRPSALNSV